MLQTYVCENIEMTLILSYFILFVSVMSNAKNLIGLVYKQLKIHLVLLLLTCEC